MSQALTNVAEIRLGGKYQLFLMRDGTVKYLGYLVDSNARPPLALDSVTDAIALSASDDAFALLRYGGKLITWGFDPTPWVNDPYYEVAVSQLPESLQNKSVKAVSTGSARVLALDTTGRVHQ
jgi:alpha-tubulin suppressor-like RCC1 family protein